MREFGIFFWRESDEDFLLFCYLVIVLILILFFFFFKVF